MSANKDRRPKALGSARAHMLLARLLRITPYAHQADAVALCMERLERVDSFALLHDMGCGKTLSVLGVLQILHEEHRASTMLVACPSSVIGSWEKECRDLGLRGRPIEMLALTQASVAKREAALTRHMLERDVRAQGGEHLPPLVVATNYEATWRMEHALRAHRFDMIVCDESQRIKAPGSRQSNAMHRIGKAARYRIIMSGTPIAEGALGWYGQFRFLDARVFGTSYVNFKARFAIEIDCGTFRKVIVNPHNTDELERIVMERAHRVSKEDAVDLPEQTSTQIEFDLSPKGRKVYDALVRDSLAVLEDEFGELGEVVAENVLTRILRLQQVTGGFAQVDGADLVEVCKQKRGALTDLMEDLRDAGKKLVIFHRFTHEGLAIEQVARKMVGKHGPPPSVINGSIPSSERGRMVREFQEGDTPFFVAQIQAAGLGITLHAASDSAFYSMGYSSGDYEQALARIHRIGQDRPVTHHHLTARRTIDETVYSSLMEKRSVAEDMVDGGWRRYLNGGQ